MAAGIPRAVNGTRSNELNPQGIKVVHELWPQASRSDRVHNITRSAATKGIVGLIECEQVLRFGGQCIDVGVRAVDAVSAPHYGLVFGNDGWICTKSCHSLMSQEALHT